MKTCSKIFTAFILLACIISYSGCGKTVTASVLYTVSTNSIGMIFNGIPAGSFIMGDNQGISNEQPAHKVTLTNFMISKFDTTYSNWVKVYDWAIANGYSFTNEGSMGYNAKGLKGSNPVVFVNWYDAVKWCNALSEMEKKTPVYYIDAKLSKVYRTGDTDVNIKNVKWDADGYMLPTEAQWEYACKASSTNEYFWGSNPADSADFTWFKENSMNSTHETGTKNPNGWGLYDIIGNVWEWCFDAYGDYKAQDEVQPAGPASGSVRIIRGGCFNSTTDDFRTAVRVPEDPTYSSRDTGFRVAAISK